MILPLSVSDRVREIIIFTKPLENFLVYGIWVRDVDFIIDHLKQVKYVRHLVLSEHVSAIKFNLETSLLPNILLYRGQ